jgi:hypothetical protein
MINAACQISKYSIINTQGCHNASAAESALLFFSVTLDNQYIYMAYYFVSLYAVDKADLCRCHEIWEP